jgi:hypothetical protein
VEGNRQFNSPAALTPNKVLSVWKEKEMFNILETRNNSCLQDKKRSDT